MVPWIPVLLGVGAIAYLAASGGEKKKPGGGGAPGGGAPGGAPNCASAHDYAKSVLGDTLYTQQIGAAVSKAKVSGDSAVLKQAAAFIDAQALLQTDAQSKAKLTFLAQCLRTDATAMDKKTAPAGGETGPGIGGGGLGDLKLPTGIDLKLPTGGPTGLGGELLCLRDKSGAVVPDKGLENLISLGLYTANPMASSTELKTQADLFRAACQTKAADQLDQAASIKKMIGG